MKRVLQNADDTFKILEAAAAAGERCPMSRQNGGPIMNNNVSKLAHDGRIEVEVSGRNWRRVTILQGPHRNKSTAPNPDPNARVHLTIDTRGTMRNGKRLDTLSSSRPQPSLPRPLTREEISRD